MVKDGIPRAASHVPNHVMTPNPTVKPRSNHGQTIKGQVIIR